ncbi:MULTISPECIES: fibronectin type III domain-containing protein [unclassified Nocardioides]|uniref:fibronectin type III domain-containing protein n=1 Tax=unclassified Nocardioides TaxID=2615069 RepID=UPI0030149B09
MSTGTPGSSSTPPADPGRTPGRSRWRPTRAGLVVGSLALGLVATTGVVSLAAGGGLAPPAVNPATIYDPQVVPDRVILTPTATPAVSQSVSWRTSTSAGAPRLQLAVAVPGVVTAERTVEATTTTFRTDLGYDVAHHSATITDLKAATTYVYRVGDGDTWSEWAEFTTAAATAEPFSFIMQGDAQNDIKSYVSRTFRAATEARPYARAVLHAGDLIDTDISDAEWGQWFEAAGYANGGMNVIAAAGNHEYYPGPTLSRHWGAQFEYPGNGPATDERVTQLYDENVYYTDYQGVRFIALNSNFPGDTAAMAAQTAWLEDVLKNNPNQWTVATFHHPVFSVTSGRDNAALRQAWLPLFEKYDVDIVMQGHDHAYGRGNLLANEAGLPAGATKDKSHTGPVYLVSVAGPKYYVPDPADSNNWVTNGAHLRVVGRDTQLYQLVDVKAGEMHVETWDVAGNLVDAFTIAKSAGKKLVTTETTARASGPGSTRGDIGRPSLPEPAVPGAVPTDEPTEEPEEPTTPTPTLVTPTVSVDRAARQVYGTSTPVRVTARVAPVAGVVPAGSVVVRDGRTVVATGVGVNASGVATAVLPRTLSAGRHALTVTFVPRGTTVRGGTSAPVLVNVTKARSTTRVTAPARVRPGQRGRLTVRVSVPGVAAPNAALVVRNGKRVVARVVLKAGKATVRLPRLAPGKHRITVAYVGTGNVAGSTSAARVVRVR